MPFHWIKPARSVRGEIFLPGDKSIAHRSIFISAIARGRTHIYNFPTNQDCLTTLRAFKKLGVKISRMGLTSSNNIGLCVEGRGLYGLNRPQLPIFAVESGTTFRLLSGVLAGQPFRTTLTAGQGLSHRPMRRITEPLRRMGAVIKTQEARSRRQEAGGRRQEVTEEYPPITIKGGNLHKISYKMPVASAQVKSALLLAGLYAKGATKIFEPIKTRDHTERMLRYFKADIKVKDKIISLYGQKELVSPGKISIPADISSASFFIIAAILLPHSHLVLKSVGINPTRMGIIRVLKRMGASIKIIPIKSSDSGGEPAGDIIVKSSSLRSTRVKRTEVPQLIDELPILMLAACFARGKTIIYGVEELRVKEADRILSMQTNLRKMGAEIYVTGYCSESGRLSEKIVIQGKGKLKGARVNSFSDHRTAMSMTIAGFVSSGPTLIDDVGCIAKSFPDFLKVIRRVIK
jgi:3-phosphoshikimate 1-carboxyvinyltransferase